MPNGISTLKNLIEVLSEVPDTQLLFITDGKVIQPDYHVTEIKLAQVRGLDCGKKTSEWNETLVQLLDGPDTPKAGAEYMKVSTFLTIAGAGDSAVKAYEGGELYFEFSSGNKALQKLSVHYVKTENGQTVVGLGSVSAICKSAIREQISDKTQSGCCPAISEQVEPKEGGACCAPH